MKTLTPQLIAALSQPVVPLVQLVKFAFKGGTMGLNSSNVNFDHAGVEYRGAGGLGTVTPSEDSAGEVKGITLTLNGAPASMVALALDGSNEWQGTPIEVHTAVLDQDYQVAGVLTDWTGFGDVMGISEDGEKCTIQATAESSAVDLIRSKSALYNNPDQQRIDPTDRGLEYVTDKSDEPIVWPAKAWYYK